MKLSIKRGGGLYTVSQQEHTFSLRGLKLFIVSFFIITTPFALFFQQALAYELAFSTYFGGTGEDQPRDVTVDSQGNIYITGGTTTTTLATSGAYDETHNGSFDVFVAKFNSSGQLQWCTYVGGSEYDRAYGIEVDDNGYIYICGRAGRYFPTTPGVFQQNFDGYCGGAPYYCQNGFVAKLSNDGSSLIWASYVGVAELCRDLAIDNNGYIYLPLGYPDHGNEPPSAWFTGSYQTSPQGGLDCGVIKITDDGTTVSSATYLGGSGNDYQEASIRVDSSGYIYLAMVTASTDIPTTAGVHDRFHNGGIDYYVAKLTPDLSDLVYATFLGDSGDNWNNTHNLAVDEQGNAYVSICATNSGFPTTTGAFQRTYGGGAVDFGVAKFSPTGTLIASTFVGGNGLDNPDGIYADGGGNVYISGQTGSTDFPITSDAYQSNNNGGSDAVLVMLSADFSQLLYSTYIGGSNDDDGRTSFLSKDGDVCISGTTYSSDWPTLNAIQDSFAGGNYDGVVAKFDNTVVNRPPVLDPIGAKSVDEGQVLEFTITASDPDGNGLTYAASNLPTGASFDPATQRFTWTPDPGDAGNYVVLFTVTDDGIPPLSDSEFVTIIVLGSSAPSPAPSPPVNAGDCFIATAAYGSHMAKEIKILSDFRNNVLLTNSVGRAFVKYYYKTSPPLANFIARHDTLRIVARWSLLPLVGVCWLSLMLGSGLTFALMPLLLVLMIAPAIVFFRKMRRQSTNN